jgi:hypothetical protein
MLKDRYIQRFHTKYTVMPSGCWQWKSPKHGGYGGVKYVIHGSTEQLAHRLSYALFVGPIPDGMAVCHTCDNPACVNPAHLWVGTWGDNNRDRVNKGRCADYKGTDAYNAKLTAEIVLQAREAYSNGTLNQARLARELGVSTATLGGAIHGRSWKHI